MASQVLSTPQEPWFTSTRGPVRRNTKRIAMGHRHPDCIAYQLQSAWVSSPKRWNISFGYKKLLDGQRNSNKNKDSTPLNHRCWSLTNYRWFNHCCEAPWICFHTIPGSESSFLTGGQAMASLSSQGHEVIFPKDAPVVWETAANGVPGTMVSSGIKCIFSIFSQHRVISSP